MRKTQDYIFLYVKGMCMGAAEVIPGISGSTAAFIGGIYEELVHSIRSIDREAIKLLFKFKFGAFWKHVNGSFLASIVGGILTSLLSFSRVFVYVLKHNPILIESFFFSLILMATPLVMREEIKKWDRNSILCFVLAFFIAFAITFLPPLGIPHTFGFIILAGVLAGGFFFYSGNICCNNFNILRSVQIPNFFPC